MTPDELCQLLSQLMQPDTTIVQQATATLKAYFKEVESLENLLLLMRDNADPRVRQISCVYLRKIVTNLWMKLNEDQRTTSKTVLLQQFVAEPEGIVKKSIAEVIGMLSKILIPNQEWPELFQFIFQATQSADLKDKEQAMLMLSVVIEYFTYEQIKQYYDNLNPIIEDYLRSDVASLKSLSIVAVNKLAQTPQAVQVMKKYSNLIPLVLAALDGQQSEDLIQKCFETFNEFAEFKKVLGPSLTGIIEKALLISADPDFGVNLREQTMYFIGQVSGVYAKPLVKKHGLGFVDKIVEQGFRITSEDPELYKGQDIDTPPDMAVEMILAWAYNVANEKIWPIIAKYLQKFGTSQDEHERAGATYVLTAVADNDACLVNVRDDIDAMTNFLVARMTD